MFGGMAMKLNHFACGLLFALAVWPAFAQTTSELTGRIETVYVRASRNFFIEKKLLKKAPALEWWAEIKIENPLANEYTTELVQLPREFIVERGDLVEASIPQAALSGLAPLFQPVLYAVPRGVAPMPELGRVTALVARHDTLRAMLFGMKTRQPRSTVAASAQACFSPLPTALAYSNGDGGATVAR